MKKSTFYPLLLILLSLIGCTTPAPQTEAPVALEESKPALLLKYDAFKLAKGDWDQNNIIEEKNNSELRDSLNNWIKSPLILEGLEFKFQEIQQAERNGKMINRAVFLLNTRNTLMIIGGTISDDLVDKLRTDRVYKLKGEYVKEIVHIPIKIDESTYYLGSHLFNISDVTEISKE